MADWLTPALAVVGTVVGSGAVTAWVAGRNDSSKRKDLSSEQDRKDAVGVLRDILKAEQEHHGECQERLSSLEAKHAQDREECIRQTKDLERRISLLERRSTPQPMPAVKP